MEPNFGSLGGWRWKNGMAIEPQPRTRKTHRMIATLIEVHLDNLKTFKGRRLLLELHRLWKECGSPCLNMPEPP